jgi:pimeloyl-ACP methyl ester carboxylesterase
MVIFPFTFPRGRCIGHEPRQKGWNKMPIPIRDDGTPGPTKHLVVLVHGFSSNVSCWDSLISLLANDIRFSNYEFRCFDYPTQMMHFGITRRIPRLSELGRDLRGFLQSSFGEASGERYIDITLVGHSMGGLVIQSFIIDHLDENLGSELKQIRQVILLATPNQGSTVVSGLRRMLYFFRPNVQESALRVLNPEIQDTLAKIQKRVIDAEERRGNECPIPFHAFWGERDRVVPEASARGPFPTTSPLQGDHFEIIRPEKDSDRAYIDISEAILHPVGHSHVFEVDEFRFLVKVSPTPKGFEHIAKHGNQSRPIHADNVASINREVAIGRNNRCTELFTIKYATLNEGFIEYNVSHVNDASNDLKRMWEDEGTHIWFQFHPEPRETYSLSMKVYKGFDEGNRNVHHHLQRNSFFRRYVFQLDLSDYVVSGFSLVGSPTLCFLRHDPEHSALCAEHGKHYPDPPVSAVNGIWRWELEHLREGVIDVRWDVEASKHAAA